MERIGLANTAQRAYDAMRMVQTNDSDTVRLRQKAELMSATEIEDTLEQLAKAILGKNGGAEGLVLVGIRRRGVPLAQRLGKLVERIAGGPVPVGELDISFYRDDLSTVAPRPVVQKSQVRLPIEDQNVVLVDDVLFTGRTTMPLWTRFSRKAVHAGCNCAYSLIAATASCRSKPPS